MARVRAKDTRPELLIRHALHCAGYRYRLHYPDVPGRPDLTFVSRRKVVFVNGCFWHSHAGCSRAKVPGSNREYWIAKLQRNRERDGRNRNCSRLRGRVGLQSKFRAWLPLCERPDGP